MSYRRSSHWLVESAVAVVCLTACHDAASPDPVPPLRFEPASVRLHVGDIYWAQLRVRNNGPLLFLSYWVDASFPEPLSVDGVGVLRTVTPGVATVRVSAKADGEDTNANLEVVVVGVRFTLSPRFFVGNRRELTGIVFSEFPSTADQRIEWRSSDPNVATLTPDGTLVGVSPGLVTITAIARADTTVRGSAQLLVEAGA